MLTERDMVNILRHRCEAEGGLRQWARNHGVSHTLVTLIFSGKAGVSKRIAAELGYTLKRVYFPCQNSADDS